MTTEHQTMRQRVAAINSHPAQLEGEQRAALEERIRCRLTGYPDQYVTEYANGDADFALWLALVDLRLARQVWLSHRDIADRPGATTTTPDATPSTQPTRRPRPRPANSSTEPPAGRARTAPGPPFN